MSSAIISIQDLSKRYLIHHESAQAGRYKRLSEAMFSKTRSAIRRLRTKDADERASEEEFWALKDVSFEIQRGDVVGIIGRNGAGKSTLLKILSRITEPTSGRVTLRGRVASLLEVGTGFHPELTGRENIFLNGAILGMSKAEIKGKFDEIVSFAEVERFLDTPVKRYSSGMYVRLAFAVAAHLEQEILVVDEVLAVGDADFQKKCLGKMQEVSQGGRTVLFVSHQMAAVQNLCRTGVLLARGRVVETGPIADIVKHYLTESSHLAELSFEDRKDRQGTGVLRFVSVSLLDSKGTCVTSLCCGDPAMIGMSIEIKSDKPLRTVRIAIGVDNDLGQRIVVWSTHLAREDFPEVGINAHRIDVFIPRLTLTPGRYGFTLFSSVNGEISDWLKNAGTFDVEAGDFYGSGQLPPSGQGCFVMDHEFRLSTAPPDFPQ
jgi:lipopolysaccharide transport system ATP-binding protein